MGLIKSMQRGTYPEPVVYGGRTEEPVTLFENHVWNGTYQLGLSPAVECSGYRHFTLHLHITSIGTDDHVICFIPQFEDYGADPWTDYLQGLFASCCFEDVDTAAGLHVCFSGDCAGRLFRLRVTEAGTSALLYFTVTARVEFWS